MSARSKQLTFWLLALPTVLLFYISLFLILKLWYPDGLDMVRLRLHLIHFSIVFALWLMVLYMMNVFESRYLQRTTAVMVNVVSAMAVNLLVAVTYFYFQPNLIITPRRFLLSLVLLTTLFLLLWYIFVQRLFRRSFVENLY